MRIAAITKFKHGALFAAMKQLGWNQSRLSEACDLPAYQIGRICNLRERPSEKHAAKIEKALIERGVDFDSREAWPETFKGFGKAITVEQIGELSQRELEAHQTYHLIQELNVQSEDLNGYDQSKLPEVLAKLKNNEREVLEMRFGIGHDRSYTLEEIGNKFKITREAVRQTEARALRRLKHPANQKILLASNPE